MDFQEIMRLQDLIKRAADVGKLEHELCAFANLRSVRKNDDILSPPKGLVDGLRARKSPLAGRLYFRFQDIENAAARLRRQLGWCHLFLEWARLDQGRAVMSYEDYKFREHYGYAVVHLYAVWSQVAALLNDILVWGVDPKYVYPRTIEAKGKTGPLAVDPFLVKAIADVSSMQPQIKDRHVEAHGSGHGAVMFDLVVEAITATDAAAAEEQAVGTKLADATARLAALRDQFGALVDALHDMPEFFVRNETAVLVRHPFIKAPHECSDEEIRSFCGLVEQGDEVEPEGLPERVRSAEALVFLQLGKTLVGTAGLKRPPADRVANVFQKAKASLKPLDFPLELGWIHVRDGHRSNGYSRILADAAVSRAGGANVYATSRTDNEQMHKTNTRVGFTKHGDPYPSIQPGRRIQLFVRVGDSAPSLPPAVPAAAAPPSSRTPPPT